ncbi:hypothetical protein PRIPAC_72493 [Pristionchus pacificus]|uniref:Uncharacterized protein n=1 Tax=Pristionchus pacificus TaxID=54126 RepID=A0A2A6BGH2_PRIPA|nr:hypothetical protein PRIPAC_72493 [Pristionchus pacificus]|eukprot:PDM65025.1 hypothetical protein PRIPAC_53281 [Pristionchus pacificus]
MIALFTTILLLAVVSSANGVPLIAAQTAVSNTCKGAPTEPCQVVLETKSTSPGMAAVTVTSDASCDRYSTPKRPCVQSGISVDSTVVHGSSNGTGPSHVSSSVVIVSNGGSNSISESSQVPSSATATTTRRLICTCTPVTVSPTAVSQRPTPTTTTVPPTTVVVAVVGDKSVTVPPIVVASGQYSDRMAKAIETAVKENEQFAENIRKSRLAFNL